MPVSAHVPAARTDGGRRGGRPPLAALPARDRAVVLAVARLRVLAYDQLRTLLFPDRHPSIVTRRVHALVRAGFVRRIRPRVDRGGAPSYVVPTAAGLAEALAMLRAETRETPAGAIVERMVPRFPRVPRTLATTAPLAHLREVNALLIAFAGRLSVDVRWMSSWERPFGRSAGAALLPQPDYVLVLDRAGSTILVLGEHDRGSESLAHFRATKADRYAPFAVLPELAAEAFGIATVELWLTVTDPLARQPRRRLRRLTDLVLAAGAGPITKVALAGAAAADPVTAWVAATDL